MNHKYFMMESKNKKDGREDKEEDETSWKRVIFESVLIFLVIVVIPYLISGVWPPFVSVTSGSMDPNMQRGDMILVVDTDRYVGENSINGIEDSVNATEIDFNKRGDVIVYNPNGNTRRTPIIHRSIYHTQESENWVDEVDQKYLKNDNCSLTPNCPAPNDGFITLGDNNNHYDQEAELSKPVKSEWVVGRAEIRIPYLGYIRLIV
jgi:signal peptidase